MLQSSNLDPHPHPPSNRKSPLFPVPHLQNLKTLGGRTPSIDTRAVQNRRKSWVPGIRGVRLHLHGNLSSVKETPTSRPLPSKIKCRNSSFTGRGFGFGFWGGGREGNKMFRETYVHEGRPAGRHIPSSKRCRIRDSVRRGGCVTTIPEERAGGGRNVSQ